MSTPVVLVASGGIAVTEVENGAPMSVAQNGFGMPVTVVASGGIPVVINRFDDDADALFARMTVKPSSARQTLYQTLITDLKTAGIWTKIDCLYVLAAHDAQAGLVNIRQNAFNLTTVGTLTFTADRGYKSDGTTGYLESGFDPTTAGGVLSQNDAHMHAWSLEALQSNMSEVGNGTFLVQARTLTNLYASRISATGSDTFANLDGLGHYLATRVASGSFFMDKDGANVATPTRVSAPLDAQAISVCGRRGGGGVTPNVRQLAAAGWGAGLTPSMRTSMYSILRAYLLAVGATA